MSHGHRPVTYETADGDTVTVYIDAAGEWRWTRKAANGRTIADGSEGYSRKDAGLRAARRTNPEKPRLR
jgi:uncharacterized protein YegP (UPF0339 family)